MNLSAESPPGACFVLGAAKVLSGLGSAQRFWKCTLGGRLEEDERAGPERAGPGRDGKEGQVAVGGKGPD